MTIKNYFRVKHGRVQGLDQWEASVESRSMWIPSTAQANRGFAKRSDTRFPPRPTDAELAEADAWYSQLWKKEIGWIQAGGDVDAEFDRLYDQDPQVRYRGGSWYFLIEPAVCLGVVGLGVVLFRRRARSKVVVTCEEDA